jgi:predicted RNA binding protein YcfA (HicA-like mRNA interferase family)
MNGKAVVTKLKENGFTLLRVSGSHHILVNGKVKVTVPVHGSRFKIGHPQ